MDVSTARAVSLVGVVLLLAAACGSDRQPDATRVRQSPAATASPAESTATPATTTETEPSRAPTASAGPATAAPTARPPTATAAPGLASAKVSLTKVASLSSPIALAVRAGDDRLWIAEKGGRIKTIRNGQVEPGTVLDLSGEISTGSEQGLLGLAFSPDGAFAYVNFTNTTGDTVVREYSFSDPRSLRPDTARTVLTVGQPFSNHNGGHLAFGRDGKLYIGLGDGGSGGDPQGNAQNLSTLLGKMLRIDPRPSGSGSYTIPEDNPFRNRQNARAEIWAYGLRNPWRYSFDSATGDLWTGDVGQNKWEEVSVAAGTSRGGENYGWDRMEATHRFEGSEPSDHHPPIYEYANDGDNCAVTGGYVYRGAAIPALQGAYVFADFCAARLRAFRVEGGAASGHRFLGPKTTNLASFGQDAAGELYVLSLSGDVLRIDPA